MEEQYKRDLMIAGKGSASGGSYNLVKVSGHGDLHGDFDCTDLRIYGKANIEGNVKANTTLISGTAYFAGNLYSDQIKIQGNSTVNGDIKTKEIRFQGNGKIKGNLAGEAIKIEGGTTIDGDCDAESFEVNGGFTIGGLLNAGNIDIRLHGGCLAKEIGGENIKVKKPSITFQFKKLLLSIFQINVGLHTESIEGDEIYLEHTKAKVVRGNDVTIGPGCEIELVEYKNNFQCRKGAKVNTHKKI